MKTYPLDETQAAQLAELATQKAFFRSLYRNYQKYGSVTEKQLIALRDEFDPRLQINGVLVVNRLFRDNQLICFRCPSLATRAVGVVGVCPACAAEQLRRNADYVPKKPR